MGKADDLELLDHLIRVLKSQHQRGCRVTYSGPSFDITINSHAEEANLVLGKRRKKHVDV
jgi:hypothetical protein